LEEINMKKISMYSIVMAAVLTAGLASFAFADDAATSADNTDTALVQQDHQQRHHHHHHRKDKDGKGDEQHKQGPMAKAMHSAFKSCKAVGIEGKACAEKLATYLADFKPNS
jgi:ABC-type Zn2+ transport system substrate-binding protein/surface adhesin